MGDNAQQAGEVVGEFAAQAGAFIGENSVDFLDKFFDKVGAKFAMTEEGGSTKIKEKAKSLIAEGKRKIGFSKDGLMLVDFTDPSAPKAWIASKKDELKSLTYDVYEIGIRNDGTPNEKQTEWVFFGAIRSDSEDVRQLKSDKGKKLDGWTTNSFKTAFEEAKKNSQEIANAQAKAALEKQNAKQTVFNNFATAHNTIKDETAKHYIDELNKHPSFQADFNKFITATGIKVDPNSPPEQKYYAFSRYVNDNGTGHLTPDEAAKIPNLKDYVSAGTTVATTVAPPAAGAAPDAAANGKPEAPKKDFDLMGMLKDLSPIAKIGIGIAMFFGPQLAVTVAKWILPDGAGKLLDTISESNIAKFVTSGTGWALIADGGAAMISNLWGKKDVNEKGKSIIADGVDMVQDGIKDPSTLPSVIQAPLKWMGVDTASHGR